MWDVEVVEEESGSVRVQRGFSRYRAPRSAPGLGRAGAGLPCHLGYKRDHGLSSGRRAASLLLRVCEDE